jgi:hypothetical protein
MGGEQREVCPLPIERRPKQVRRTGGNTHVEFG